MVIHNMHPTRKKLKEGFYVKKYFQRHYARPNDTL